MTTLYRVITAALFAIHLTVGCCVHHAHGCDGKEQCLPAAADASDGLCGTDHADHEHHGPHDCQGAKCTFIRPGDEMAAQWLCDAVQMPATLTADNAFAPSDNCSEQHFFLSGRLLLPVRLHLANEILLI
jgi:hypothetical protein